MFWSHHFHITPHHSAICYRGLRRPNFRTLTHSQLSLMQLVRWYSRYGQQIHSKICRYWVAQGQLDRQSLAASLNTDKWEDCMWQSVGRRSKFLWPLLWSSLPKLLPDNGKIMKNSYHASRRCILSVHVSITTCFYMIGFA